MSKTHFPPNNPLRSKKPEEAASMNRRHFLQTSVPIGLGLALAGEPGQAEKAAASPAKPGPERAFYVSLEGKDTWSGKLPVPNSSKTDGPFASLDRARDEIRRLKSQSQGSLNCPVTVMLRGGKYFLKEKFLLKPEDSGAPGCPVTYRAHPGEEVILSGGKRVTGWKPYKGNILQSRFPKSEIGSWFHRQLFYNGQRQVRARFPNLDPKDPAGGGWIRMTGADPENPLRAFQYPAGAFPRKWAKPTQAEVNCYAGWDSWFDTVRIEKMDASRRIITMIDCGFQGTFDRTPWYEVYPFEKGKRFYVENLLEELDQPGEWCYDTEEETIYFWPPSGSLKPGDEVVVPVLDSLIELHGVSTRVTTPVTEVNITGLTFTETTSGDNMHHQRVDGAGPMYARVGWKYAGDALLMKDCERCRVEGNVFDQVGGNAIYVFRQSGRNLIRFNTIKGAGCNGIVLAGMVDRHPTFNQVTDNLIEHSGTINRYTAGIFCAVSDGNLLSHNLIRHVPHHAVNLASNSQGRNIVEFNRIHDTGELIHDTGAVNCWMEIPPPTSQRCGHVFRYNHISDTRNGCHGLYLDDFTSNCLVYGNLLVRVSGHGVQVHAGKNNVIENNVIVGGVAIYNSPGVDGWDYYHQFTRLGYFSGTHVTRNIFYKTKSAGVLFGNSVKEVSLGYSDQNLFWEPEFEPANALQERKERGFEAGSLMADPKFVNPSTDDYRLQPDSPALDLGILPIDFRLIGPREKLRAKLGLRTA